MFLFGLYDIYKDGNKIGKAEVSREGLYYRFRCNCDLPDEKIYRLTVTCGGKTESLGIPIPNGDTFWLSTRLPVSKFSGDEPHFYAIPRENQNWTPVSVDMPFPHISQLSEGILQERDGQMGILISESVTRDSDPNP